MKHSSSNPDWRAIQELVEAYQLAEGDEQNRLRGQVYTRVYQTLPALTRIIVSKKSAQGGYSETDISEQVQDRILKKRDGQITQLAREYDTDRNASFYTWLSAVVRNEFTDWYRKHVKNGELIEFDENQDSPLAPSIETQLERKRQIEDLQSELGKLTPAQREYIDSCYLDGKSHKGYASEKNLNETKVSRLKKAALNALKRSIQQKRSTRSLAMAKRQQGLWK